MGRSVLESLRSALQDDVLHLAIGAIKSVYVLEDRSTVKLKVGIFPDLREIIATLSWGAVGPEAGMFQLPNVNDMVVVAMPEGDEDIAVVLSRLTNKEDKMPLTAVDGSTVIKALAGKKLWITSDTRINISKGDTQPVENLLLGKEFKAAYSEHLANDAAHMHIGNLGFATAVPMPTFKAKYDSIKASPVDDDKMLSDIAFTEKGS